VDWEKLEWHWPQVYNRTWIPRLILLANTANVQCNIVLNNYVLYHCFSITTLRFDCLPWNTYTLISLASTSNLSLKNHLFNHLKNQINWAA
jgi:hypothetical protein